MLKLLISLNLADMFEMVMMISQQISRWCDLNPLTKQLDTPVAPFTNMV